MLNLTPTSCKVNDMRINEQLATAARYQELTRGNSVAEAKSVQRAAIQAPRISLISRLIQARLRPA